MCVVLVVACLLKLYNIPLEEDGACEMFRKLAISTAQVEGRDIKNVGRWNGKKNADGSTTGQRATEIVCSHSFFTRFLLRYPCVRMYRTSTMSIMRAKKATPEVNRLFACWRADSDFSKTHARLFACCRADSEGALRWFCSFLRSTCPRRLSNCGTGVRWRFLVC